MMHCHVGPEMVDPADVMRRVMAPGNGGIATFVGTVRDHADGELVTGLAYSAYEAMAQRELSLIVREAAGLAQGLAVAAVHRTGSLGVGEISVAIAAGHAHRGPAFEACRYVIEQIKQRVPIWKREQFASGVSDWVIPAGNAGEAAVEETHAAADHVDSPRAR